jgi:peptidoglycan/LPS O-acetylase OafA/YrhL
MTDRRLAPDARPQVARLAFLDGLRGLVALYLVLFHVLADGEPTMSAETGLLNLMRLGDEAAVFFVVLSGFVNALPVARSPQLALRGRAGGFLRRRARRLLPAYYAALAIQPLYVAAANGYRWLSGRGADWGALWASLGSAEMISHLLLLHNLSSEWAWAVNPTLWTMATLWWSYVAFALLLWPVWKRYGITAAVGASFLLGLLPAALGALGLPTLHGHPHLIAAFGLGMGGAALLYSPPAPRRMAGHKWLSAAVLLAFLAFVGLKVVEQCAMPDHSFVRFAKNVALSTALTGYIVLHASVMRTSAWPSTQPTDHGPVQENEARRDAVPPGAERRNLVGLLAGLDGALTSRPLACLGRISYSLYLTHYAFWQVMRSVANAALLPQQPGLSLEPLWARALVAVPLALLGAYGFYLLFERPFVRRRA